MRQCEMVGRSLGNPRPSGRFILRMRHLPLNEGRLRLASSPERYDSGRLVGNPSLIGKVRIAR
jgi:hypothetical protein